ncbi:glycosyl transferase [Rhodoferax lacus]|uniref:Glycosyl transferase n=1 Tax=Rhodoferax lacus TaxID=2184758 RepID=A0A3E1RH11_9BURK|nr:glycosyltransferase family 2 protein [Rhodoferax lacus]RFO98667.1 glycosyl transferase [Rhodoferax lacus]
MPTADLISIVIATYNRSDTLVAVLASLANQDDNGFEVIVADDGSMQVHRDAIQAAATTYGLSLTHVWHPDVGFTLARVRNLGVSASRGSYLVFLDGDCVPDTDFVRRHRQLRESGYLVMGSRVLLSQSITTRVLSTGMRLEGQGALFWLRRRLHGDANKLGAIIRLPDLKVRKVKGFRWRGIRGCNMGVWRKDYEAVNGFDESFIGWGHEDADFVLRLHNHGVKRKNGFYATEVYHLWHKEATRDAEGSNAAIVGERLQSGISQATIGYRESKAAKDVVVHRWG